MELDYLLYSEVSPHWILVCNVTAMPPVIFALQGGSKGGGYNICEPPPWRGIGGSAPEAKK